MPRPDLPIVVGLDGGYVHASRQRSRTDGWFEVIAASGARPRAGHLLRVCANPRHDVLKAPGDAGQLQVTVLTDGGEDIRALPCYLNAQAEHLIDSFHLTMRITVMANMERDKLRVGLVVDCDSSRNVSS